MNSKRPIAFLFMAIGISSACAYDADVHRTLTMVAIHHYNFCNASEKVSQAAANTLVHCNAEEDRADIHRVFNWHFYARSEKSLRTWFPFATTTFAADVKLYSDVASDKTVAPEKRIQALGQGLHYLQDATNPSHVIPVLHGSIFGKDAFDSMPPQFLELFSTSFRDELCSRSDTSEKSVQDRVVFAAERTLERVQRSSPEGFDPDNYWHKPLANSWWGWGEYASRAEGSMTNNVREKFREFVHEQNKEAIRHTFDTLRSQRVLLSDRRLTDATLPTCENRHDSFTPPMRGAKK